LAFASPLNFQKMVLQRDQRCTSGGVSMRPAILVLLGLLTVRAWADQLFIPVDEEGNPLESTEPGRGRAAEPDIVVNAEDPAAKVVREAHEAEYRLALSAVTQAYVDCLSVESERLLGSDFEKCADARTKLHALFPADKAEHSISCVESAVLGKPRNTGVSCHLVAQAPLDTSNERRWK